MDVKIFLMFIVAENYNRLLYKYDAASCLHGAATCNIY